MYNRRSRLRCNQPSLSAHRHGFISSINYSDFPRFCIFQVYFHIVVAHVEGDVGHVKKVIGEIFLDHVTFVSRADHEIIDPMSTVNFKTCHNIGARQFLP